MDRIEKLNEINRIDKELKELRHKFPLSKEQEKEWDELGDQFSELTQDLGKDILEELSCYYPLHYDMVTNSGEGRPDGGVIQSWLDFFRGADYSSLEAFTKGVEEEADKWELALAKEHILMRFYFSVHRELMKVEGMTEDKADDVADEVREIARKHFLGE